MNLTNSSPWIQAKFRAVNALKVMNMNDIPGTLLAKRAVECVVLKGVHTTVVQIHVLVRWPERKSIRCARRVQHLGGPASSIGCSSLPPAQSCGMFRTLLSQPTASLGVHSRPVQTTCASWLLESL